MAKGFKQASDSLNEESKYNPESVSEFAKEAESTTIPSTVKFSKGFSPSKSILEENHDSVHDKETVIENTPPIKVKAYDEPDYPDFPKTSGKIIVCSKCGKRLSAGAIFCTGCGTRIISETKPSMSDVKIPVQKGKRKTVPAIIGIAAAIMVIIGVFLIFGSSSSPGNLEKMLNSNDVSGAVDLYVKKCKTPSKQSEYSNKLIEYEEKVYDEYNQGTITLDQAQSHYDTVDEVISRLSLNIDTRTSKERLLDLSKSKESFEKGKEKLEQLKANPKGTGKVTFLDEITAILRYFNNVESYDAYYSQAQTLREEAISLRDSTYKTLTPDLEGTYYPKVLEYWPQTHDYADYLLDLEDPTDDNKVHVKYYKKDGTIIYDEYVDYEANGMFDHQAYAHIRTDGSLGVINVHIYVKQNELVEVTAKRDGDFTGVATEYEKRSISSNTSNAANDENNTKVDNPTSKPQAAVSQEKKDGEYLFNSDSEYITDSYLDTKTKDEIRLILNEIYARHGYIFSTDKYISYFAAKSWYEPQYDSIDDAEKQFNAVEQQNKTTIVNYEKAHGWR